MRRLNRIAAELLALAGLWLLWDLRVALTFGLVVLVIHAIQDELRGRPAPPVLQEPAGRARGEGR